MVRSNESTGDVGIVVAFTDDDDDAEISGVNVFMFSPSLVVVALFRTPSRFCCCCCISKIELLFKLFLVFLVLSFNDGDAIKIAFASKHFNG